MEKINFNDFKNICRICMSNYELKPVRDSEIFDIYHKLTDSHFETNDELPQQICLICFEKLNEIQEFSMQCKQTHSTLIKCLIKHKSKRIKKDPNELIHLKEEITIEEHKVEFNSDEELNSTNEMNIEPDITEETNNEFCYEQNINCFEQVLLKPNTSNIKFENEDSSNANDLINEDTNILEETPTKKRNKRYTCDICNDTMTHLKTYNKHMRGHSGERPYKCTECPMSYIDPFWLKRHILSHSDDHQLKCDVCDKVFNEPSSLIKHKAAHSDERPFECDVCEKTFKFAHNLMGHKKIHSGERPYECDVCPKAFTSSWNLLRHKRVHSGERPYKCQVCEKSFVESNKLRKHIRKHHEQLSHTIFQ